MKEEIFTLEVFRSQVSSIAGEMGAALHRTAFSPNIKERKDHSCAVFDGEGRLVAQAEHIPVHLGAMPATVRAVLETCDLLPGDVVVINDPFLGGTHLPDISMVSPVYFAGRRVAILASRAHHSDVGGAAPGSLSIASDIYQEGLIIPPVLIVEGGDYRRDIEAMICANSRSPRERSGDLEAQAGAHATGEKRLGALLCKQGTERSARRFEDIMSYSERLTRISIAAIPDGTYKFTDYLDDDGMGTFDIPVAVEVTVDGSEVFIDFAGTSGPVRGPFNCPMAVTLSAVSYVLRCVCGEDVPASDGSLRPVHVAVPEGCLLDARSPYPVAGGNVETSQRVVDALLGALAPALPALIPASSSGTMSNLSIGSMPGAGRDFSYYETIPGGTGGQARGDGESATHSHMSNTMNTPVEALEHSMPLRVRKYGIRRGSGGAGRHKGGDGIVREIEVLEDSTVTLLADRRRNPPGGLAGGKPGKRGEDFVTRDGRRSKPRSKGRMDLKAGDAVEVRTPGGGGWGLKG